jgi:polysaccharide pyruvyl transferase WcaK-like protein
MKGEKNKVFILLGNYDGTNLGDDSILCAIVKRLSSKGRVIIPSRNADYVRKKYGVYAVNIVSFEFLKEFIKAKTLIVGGGGIFSKYMGPLAKLIPIAVLISKLLMRKKVIFYRIGVYSSTPFVVLLLLKFSMLFADEISVRDKASLKTLSIISHFKKIKIGRDPSFSVTPISKNKAAKLLQENKVNIDKFMIGISLKYTLNNNVNKNLILSVAKFLDWIVSKFDAEIIFIPFCFNTVRWFENDLHLAMKIKSIMKNKKSFKILHSYNYTPYEIKGMIRLMDFFIGMRLHSIYFSTSVKVPTIGISYEEKCEDFLSSKKIPYVNVENVSFNVLKNLFMKSRWSGWG